MKNKKAWKYTSKPKTTWQKIVTVDFAHVVFQLNRNHFFL